MILSIEYKKLKSNIVLNRLDKRVTNEAFFSSGKYSYFGEVSKNGFIVHPKSSFYKGNILTIKGELILKRRITYLKISYKVTPYVIVSSLLVSLFVSFGTIISLFINRVIYFLWLFPLCLLVCVIIYLIVYQLEKKEFNHLVNKLNRVKSPNIKNKNHDN